MTNFFTRIAIKRQLNKLNHIIDMKIIEGKSYKRESKLHRALRQQLKVLGGMHHA